MLEIGATQFSQFDTPELEWEEFTSVHGQHAEMGPSQHLACLKDSQGALYFLICNDEDIEEIEDTKPYMIKQMVELMTEL
jgi:hypothetical protein